MKRKFTEQEIIRRNKYQQLLEKNKNPFLITKFNRSCNSLIFNEKYNKYNKEELEKKAIDNIKLAGRIRTIRIAGKALFLNIQDQEGFMQLYVRKEFFTEEEFQDIKNYDIGDIIGATGLVMKTKTGQITLKWAF